MCTHTQTDTCEHTPLVCVCLETGGAETEKLGAPVWGALCEGCWLEEVIWAEGCEQLFCDPHNTG